MTRAPVSSRVQGRVHTGGAGADDGDLWILRRSQGQIRYARWRRHPCSSSIRRRWTTTRALIPEQPARITAIYRELEQRDWLGFERVHVAKRRPRDADRRAPAGLRGGDRAPRPSGAAPSSIPTPSSARARSTQRSTAAGGAVGLVDLLLDRSAPVGLQRPPAARTSRRARPGDGLLSVQQRRRRRAACRSRPRARARARPRLGRPPRQRDQRHLPREPRGSVRLDPPVAAVPGHGSGVGRGRGRGRPGYHGQPAGARRHRRRESTLARRSRRRAARPRLRAPAAADLGRASTRTATTRSPTVVSPRRGSPR